MFVNHVCAALSKDNIIAKGYPFFTNADLTSFIMLFFDNLATIFGCVGALVFVVGFTPQFVYTHMMGGACISFAWGNLLYAFQASKVAMKTGKMDTCAQPYGINPPASFQKIFAIILPCFYSKLATFGHSSSADATPEELEETMLFTWNVACASNLIGGLIEFSGSFIAPISRNVPEAAFLVPLSGVGITYLGLLPYMQVLEAQASGFPFVGMVPLIFLWLGFFGSPPGVPLFGKIPPALISCLVGVGAQRTHRTRTRTRTHTHTHTHLLTHATHTTSARDAWQSCLSSSSPRSTGRLGSMGLPRPARVALRSPMCAPLVF